MSTEYVAGFVVGFLLVFAALVFVRKQVHKHVGGVPNGKCSFDERQELVRGKAFKYGFFTIIACNIAIGWVPSIFEVQIPMDTSVALFMCVAVGIVVFASYAIWNEGYFALNERPKAMMILFAFIAAVNVFAGIMNGVEGKLVENGVLQMGCVNIICAVIFIIIFIVVLLKSIVRKNED